jgi:hypothetical protein
MTVHFISENWERVKFCLACSKFDKKHTASNIFQKIENTAQDWDLSDKIKVWSRLHSMNQGVSSIKNVANSALMHHTPIRFIQSCTSNKKFK